MKTCAIKEEQYLADSKGNRTGEVLDLRTDQHLREAGEKLADIQVCDSTRARAHAEIAAGPIRNSPRTTSAVAIPSALRSHGTNAALPRSPSMIRRSRFDHNFIIHVSSQSSKVPVVPY